MLRNRRKKRWGNTWDNFLMIAYTLIINPEKTRLRKSFWAHWNPSCPYTDIKKLKKKHDFLKYSDIAIFETTWSHSKFLVSKIIYCSRSLHFWGLFINLRWLGVPCLTLKTYQNTIVIRADLKQSTVYIAMGSLNITNTSALPSP